MAEGSDFGYEDPRLDSNINHNDDEQEVDRTRRFQQGKELNKTQRFQPRRRQPPPTTSERIFKCKLRSTSGAGFLIPLMKKPL